MGTTIGGRLFVHSYIGEEMYQLYGFGLKRAPKVPIISMQMETR